MAETDAKRLTACQAARARGAEEETYGTNDRNITKRLLRNRAWL